MYVNPAFTSVAAISQFHMGNCCWYIGNDTKLSDRIRDVIADEDNDVYVSVVSLWEIAINTSIGKFFLDKPFEKSIVAQVGAYGFQLLRIEPTDTISIVNLPFHHRDPFVRMLIVQAMNRGLTLVSEDSSFNSYNVKLLN